jgi:hypothetical protein
MEAPIKTNRLAIISFISGLIVVISLGLYRVFYLLAYPSSAGNSAEPINRIFLTLMDLTVPVRNLGAASALLSGILALREIKMKAGSEKGRGFAWAGIISGAGWILVGLLVGITFFAAEMLH